MEIVKKLRNITPLCFISSKNLVMYRFGKLLIYNLEELTVKKEIPIMEGLKDKILRILPFFDRTFRHSPRCAIALNSSQILLNFQRSLMEFNLDNGTLEAVFTPSPGVRPLQFTYIKNIENFSDGVYFGGYVFNHSKAEVSIYWRYGKGKWETVYTFEEGLINHIHAIIPDENENCVWILTGDDDKSVAFWKATNNFLNVEKVVGGNQKFRGCVGFPTAQGLLYATDSQWETNTIRILKKNNGVYESEEICEINGSCIYGCKWGDLFVFETSVEGEGLQNFSIKSILNSKPSSGIKTPYTCIYAGTPEKGFEKIFALKKDILPFLLQLGAFLFPQGENNTRYLVTKAVATSKYDMTTLILQK